MPKFSEVHLRRAQRGHCSVGSSDFLPAPQKMCRSADAAVPDGAYLRALGRARPLPHGARARPLTIVAALFSHIFMQRGLRIAPPQTPKRTLLDSSHVMAPISPLAVLAHRTGASLSKLRSLPCPYSPECVELEFSEVRGYKRAPIWASRLPLAPDTIPARPD